MDLYKAKKKGLKSLAFDIKRQFFSKEHDMETVKIKKEKGEERKRKMIIQTLNKEI